MTLLIFIIVLAVLVLAHEWGHFIAARKSGLTVEEFGFGFPPRILAIKKGETTYSINLLPLGGFVKILGEDGGETSNPKSFASKSAGIRALITVSGVAMNFLLAVVILIAGFSIGLPQALDDETAAIAKNIQIQVVAVSAGSPAEQAGLSLGDAIVKAMAPKPPLAAGVPVEGLGTFGETAEIKDISDLQRFVKKYAGKEILMEVKRGKRLSEIKITPRVSPPEGDGPLGVALAKTGIVSYPIYKSVWLGIKSSFILTWEITKGFAGLVKNLVIRGEVPQEISGPVGIAVLTGQAASLGFIYLLNLVALISLNLAVLNLAPFPALDGGRLLFLGIEKIKGGKVNPKIENWIHSAGLALLLLLAILITWRDILKFKLF